MICIRGILAWYIGLCATLVLVIQALSAFHAIALGPLLLGVAVVALLWFVIVQPRPVIRRVRIKLPDRLIQPSTLPFLLVLPVIAAISFALGWHMPPNNWDSMTYHLSRAAYWRQWHTLAHFPTNNWRQNVFPGNAEVLLLVTLLVAHSAKLAFLVQFSAYLAATIAVYGLGRQLGLRPAYAVVGAGAFASMPEVVLQSSSAQNDLVVASFVACTVYLFIIAIRESRLSCLVLSGAALGLAIGTKPTAVLALPGIFLGATAVVWQLRQEIRITRKSIAAVLAGLLLAGLLGAPWYVANQTSFGNISGPPEVAHTQEVAHPSAATLRVNLLRYLVAFVDPAGPSALNPLTDALVCARATELRARLVVAADIPQVEPAVEWPGTGYNYAPACDFNEDLSWFGLAGWLAVSIALIWSVLGIAIRRMGLAWLLAAGTASFIVCASLLLRWSPWQGRLLITMIALSAPLLGLLARELSSRRIGHPLLQLIVLYAALTGFCTVSDNVAKPLAAWGATPTAIQVATRPEMASVLEQIARTVPTNGYLGVFLNGDDWDFPLFSPHLDRHIEPLVLSTGATYYTPPQIAPPYVLAHQPEASVAILFHQLHFNDCHAAWTIKTVNDIDPWKLYDCAPNRKL